MATLRRYAEAGHDVAVDAATWRPGGFTSENTYMVARTLHRKTAGASSRAALAAIKAVHERGVPRESLPPSWVPTLAGLRRDGVATAPSILTDDEVVRLRDFATTAPAAVQARDGSRSRGTFASRDASAASVTLIEHFVLDQSIVQGVIANPDVLAFARAHFGATPVVHAPQLYWTCAGAPLSAEARAQSARQFHWDFDGLGGLRLHIYLTDVDAHAAPMSYVAGSQRPGSLRSAALRSADLGVPDSEVWKEYPKTSLRTITGPAGTTFVSDSQGLHRGNDAVSAHRLFLVMPFQATGFGGYQLRPRPVTVKDPGLADGIRRGRPEFAFFRERSEKSQTSDRP